MSYEHGPVLALERALQRIAKVRMSNGLHTVNAVLFFLNALLWAFVAKQPAIATVWLAVGLGELYVVTKTDLVATH